MNNAIIGNKATRRQPSVWSRLRVEENWKEVSQKYLTVGDYPTTSITNKPG